VIDLAVVVEQWIAPVGRVDTDAVVAAMSAELTRLLDEGQIRLTDEGPITVSGLRIDGTLVPLDRHADATALGAALARVVVLTFSRADR
jgi:hypothetical protein